MKINFSVEGIEQATKTLQTVQKEFDLQKKKFVYESLEYIQKEAQENIRKTTGHTAYVPTEQLLNSWILDAMNQTLTNVAPYSALVEYGTGIVGEKNPHPTSNADGYAYNKNNHDEKGWYYQDDDGEWHWTKGLEAHSFLYDAIIEYCNVGYKEIAERTILKAFKHLKR